jgi:hypothetical protein
MQMPRELAALAAGIAIVAGTCLASLAADSRFAGYLYDRHCADNLKSQGFAPDDHHTKECALNENCSRDGYAVYCKGKWYRLDKKGNELARRLLQTTKTPEGHFVIVSGTLEKEQLKVTTIKELARQE